VVLEWWKARISWTTRNVTDNDTDHWRASGRASERTRQGFVGAHVMQASSAAGARGGVGVNGGEQWRTLEGGPLSGSSGEYNSWRGGSL